METSADIKSSLSLSAQKEHWKQEMIKWSSIHKSGRKKHWYVLEEEPGQANPAHVQAHPRERPSVPTWWGAGRTARRAGSTHGRTASTWGNNLLWRGLAHRAPEESPEKKKWVKKLSVGGRKGEKTNKVVNVWRSISCVSLWPYGQYHPWNSPGQNTGVGSLSLL